MINSVGASTPSQSGSTIVPPTGSTTVSQDTFLQLMIQQIKHQDPLNPADGTEFLTQLAQFSELEQMMAINSGVSTLVQNLTPLADANGSTDQSTGAGINV